MKVCHVVSTFPRSEDDPEVPWLVELLKHLKKNNLDIKVFAPAYRGLKDHEISGIPVKRFRYFFKRFETLTHEEGATNKIRNPLYMLLPCFYLFFGSIAFLKYCKKERFDLIHVHWPMPHAIFGYFAKKLRKIPFVSTFYTAEIVLAKRIKLLRPLLKFLLKHSAKTIAISKYTRDELEKITAVKAAVIPYGSTIKVKGIRRHPKKPEEKWRLLFVGRLIERKGLRYLLEAMPSIMEKYNVELYVVGSGKQMSNLINLADDLLISHKVIFEGRVSNERLKELYGSCDIFVLPSIIDSRGETEGLGVVLLEALAHHMPVVASNVGGITDIIRDGETGFMVKQEDPQALSQKIISVIENHKSALKIAKNGFEFSKHYYNWERITSEIKSVYESALA